MSNHAPRLHKKPEEVEAKLQALIGAAASLHDLSSGDKLTQLSRLRSVRASALNLLSRTSTRESVYYRELAESEFTDVLALRGVLAAALEDYRDGFMADAGLLVSAEVFRDLLVQAELLLENDFKDAAAVTARAVLEDGLRRLCISRGLDVEPKDTISKLNDRLYKAGVYMALQHKEITAKAQVGNDAAHARVENFNRADVEAFVSFVERFLAMYLT